MDTTGAALDRDTYHKLKNLIETLTHSGLKSLDEKIFTDVKKMCRSSAACTEKAYLLILYQLKKNHSEIRLIAFQMCVELFKRSALFRELVLIDLRLIFELIAETNPKKKLPPPKTAAKILETLAISTIKKWTDEFGETYKELQIAFHYLKHSKKVNFNLMIINNEIEIQKNNFQKKIQEEKMKAVIEEIKTNEPDIENAIKTLQNCMSLLVPLPEDFFISGDSENCFGNAVLSSNSVGHSDKKIKNEEINLMEFGITKDYAIVVQANPTDGKVRVKKTEENSSIIQNAEDTIKLMKIRFLPLITKWNHTCIKNSTNNGAIIKKIIEMREKINTCISKFNELYIESSLDTETDNTESDDEFEEVIKEDYEVSAINTEDFLMVDPVPVKQNKLESGWKISLGEEGDPTSAVSTIKKLQQNPSTNAGNFTVPLIESTSSMQTHSYSLVGNSTQVAGEQSGNISRKNKLLAFAPKLPFDIDLYHWEDQNLTAPTLLSVKLDNPKFWGTSSVDEMDEIPNPDGVTALRTRVIEFSGKFEPIKWSCRAPLSNGTLCPRRDRFKCPFHGVIVPRDENGICQTATTGTLDVSKEKIGNDWQDPEFLADVKFATGVDLRIPRRKVKTRKKLSISKTHKFMNTSSTALKEIERKKFPGLTDTIGRQNNAFKRISNKIFKKSSLNKVAAVLDKMDFVKHRDKFGDQFNYVHGT